MRSKPIYTELQFQERLNEELKDALDLIEKLEEYNASLARYNEEILKQLSHFKDLTVEFGMGVHDIKFVSDICTYRPLAIRELQGKIISEMSKEGCIKYEFLEDGAVMASAKVLDWLPHEVKSFTE